VLSGARTPTPSYTKKELFSALVRVNDHNIPTALSRQLTTEGKQYYGAVFDGDSVVSPIGTAQLIQTLMCGYVTSDSKFFRSPELLQRMEMAAAALINLQHDDGTIDLLTTNFHSTPDLGFTIFPLAISYSIMMKKPRLDFGKVPPLIKQYFLKAGDALSVGGIHTPNHRWVVSAALSWLYSFFPEPRYKSRIDQWLAEKIDIDPDGQYNERSTAVYTPITNRSLLDIASRMKYNWLYDVVRKNLNLTFYFVHSNGEIATESSNRQDQYLHRNMAGYYLAYNYMAIKDRDSRFGGMVHYIEDTVPAEHLAYMLPLFIEDPALLEDFRDTTPIPTKYHRHFKYSDMVRIREGAVDMSVITNNPTFFTYFKGDAALEAVRLSSAFFGKGQFQSQAMERLGDTYVLSSTLSGPYYQPLPSDKIPPDTDAWTGVPRSEREQSEIQTLHTRIFVTQTNGKATIRVSVEGPKNLPVTLELAFREGGTLQNVDPKQGIENAFLAKHQEYAIYQRGKDTITIGPGVASHKWTQLRGALPKLPAQCLYLTDYAPCEFQFTIE
ncbi:MAG TPA: hypothetical protein VFO54_08765, partial [Chryseosolibacter sp.]|nr:hypothetical protein [Chryseosolibacter sp.]